MKLRQRPTGRLLLEAHGERPLRRQRDADVSAEMVEAREEADAIFGSDQEMKELLDFTRGELRLCRKIA